MVPVFIVSPDARSSDDKALLPHRCGEDIVVTGARETFVDRGVDVVAQRGGDKPRCLWEILV